MKRKVLFLFGMIIITLAQAQAQEPPGISHQAVIRDANNELVANAQIGIQVNILQGSAEGEAVYVETHTPISNANGLITYVIGQGAVESGLFAEIDWSAGPYFLKTEADPMGGTDYTITGVTQFHSVPYALHSITAETAETLKDGSHLGEINYWDGENWVPIEPGEHEQTLRLCEGVPRWGPCFYELALFADPLWGGTVTGEGEYDIGTEVSIIAIPNQGWEFVNWTGDIEHLDDADLYEAVVTMPASNVTLTAVFQEEDEYPGFSCGDNITFTYRGQEVTYGTIFRNGLCWLDRNLGADPMPFVPADDATGNTDERLFGDLFQWGRLNDDHQDRSSGTTETLSNTDIPGHGDFITVSSQPMDWRMPQNDNLWQGEEGINNPCPPGWRVPTESELNAERLSWSSNNAEGAYESILKWPLAGNRYGSGGIGVVGSHGTVWSSTVVGHLANFLHFVSAEALINSYNRVSGLSVRCVSNLND